ncbi:MAG: hypothetical protein V4613_03715 [Bacteroidota bacterium]
MKKIVFLIMLFGFGVSQVIYLSNPFIKNPTNISSILVEEEEEGECCHKSSKFFDCDFNHSIINALPPSSLNYIAYSSYTVGRHIAYLSQPETPPPNCC